MNRVDVTLFKMEGCGHCINFQEEWDNFNKNINGEWKDKLHELNINVKSKTYVRGGGSKDNISDAEHNMKENGVEVNGYPTIVTKFHNAGKYAIYDGERTASDLLDFIISNSKNVQTGGTDYDDTVYLPKYIKYKAKYLELLKKTRN